MDVVEAGGMFETRNLYNEIEEETEERQNRQFKIGMTSQLTGGGDVKLASQGDPDAAGRS